jgi:hypothetical protein
MARDTQREREDDGPVARRNTPVHRHRVERERDHGAHGKHTQHQRDAEPAEDLRDLEEEVRALDLLLGGTPLDVVAEQMRKEGLGQVDRQPAEEEEATSGVSIEIHNVRRMR